MNMASCLSFTCWVMILRILQETPGPVFSIVRARVKGEEQRGREDRFTCLLGAFAVRRDHLFRDHAVGRPICMFLSAPHGLLGRLRSKAKRLAVYLEDGVELDLVVRWGSLAR